MLDDKEQGEGGRGQAAPPLHEAPRQRQGAKSSENQLSGPAWGLS